jgi:hypothetical protein
LEVCVCECEGSVPVVECVSSVAARSHLAPRRSELADRLAAHPPPPAPSDLVYETDDTTVEYE